MSPCGCRVEPCIVPHNSLHILQNLSRRSIQLPGIAEDIFEHTQAGGVVIAVADAFVENEGDVHVGLFCNRAVGFQLVGTFFCAERAEGRAGTEVVQMVIDGRDAEGRDGYLNTFTYNVQPGQKIKIAIEGDNKATRLFINGKLVEELNIQERWMDKEGKSRMRNVRTLVFPLEKAGNFKSKITNLKVWQK